LLNREVQISRFAPEFESEVVDLVLGIQCGEFGIDISEADQANLPPTFPIMKVDTKFYHLGLPTPK
jgi:hypothetical protein